MIVYLLIVILLISVVWAWWSLRDLKSPGNLVPKFEKKISRVLSGVIHLLGFFFVLMKMGAG